MHFFFPPLEGDKLFPTAGICLISAADSSSTQICKMQPGALQTNEVLSCKSVIILWSTNGLLFSLYPSEVLGLLMFQLFDGRSDSQCFQSLCPVVSLARATEQTNIIVSVATRNVNCGIFQSIRQGTCIQ